MLCFGYSAGVCFYIFLWGGEGMKKFWDGMRAIGESWNEVKDSTFIKFLRIYYSILAAALLIVLLLT